VGVPAAFIPLVWFGMSLAKSGAAARAGRVADGRHGGAFGWYALVQGLMALPAGLLAGWLWDRGPHGPAVSFAVTAGLSLAACGLLAAVTRRR
jgi:hypothetical protein